MAVPGSPRTGDLLAFRNNSRTSSAGVYTAMPRISGDVDRLSRSTGYSENYGQNSPRTGSRDSVSSAKIPLLFGMLSCMFVVSLISAIVAFKYSGRTKHEAADRRTELVQPVGPLFTHPPTNTTTILTLEDPMSTARRKSSTRILTTKSTTSLESVTSTESHHPKSTKEIKDTPFYVGQSVEYRNNDDPWKKGVVKSSRPLKVQPAGYDGSYQWDEVRPLQASQTLASTSSEEATSTHSWKNLRHIGKGACLDSNGVGYSYIYARSTSLHACLSECQRLEWCLGVTHQRLAFCYLHYAGRLPHLPSGYAQGSSSLQNGSTTLGGKGTPMQVSPSQEKDCYGFLQKNQSTSTTALRTDTTSRSSMTHWTTSTRSTSRSATRLRTSASSSTRSMSTTTSHTTEVTLTATGTNTTSSTHTTHTISTTATITTTITSRSSRTASDTRTSSRSTTASTTISITTTRATTLTLTTLALARTPTSRLSDEELRFSADESEEHAVATIFPGEAIRLFAIGSSNVLWMTWIDQLHLYLKRLGYLVPTVPSKTQTLCKPKSVQICDNAQYFEHLETSRFGKIGWHSWDFAYEDWSDCGEDGFRRVANHTVKCEHGPGCSFGRDVIPVSSIAEDASRSNVTLISTWYNDDQPDALKCFNGAKIPKEELAEMSISGLQKLVRAIHHKNPDVYVLIMGKYSVFHHTTSPWYDELNAKIKAAMESEPRTLFIEYGSSPPGGWKLWELYQDRKSLHMNHLNCRGDKLVALAVLQRLFREHILSRTVRLVDFAKNQNLRNCTDLSGSLCRTSALCWLDPVDKACKAYGAGRRPSEAELRELQMRPEQGNVKIAPESAPHLWL